MKILRIALLSMFFTAMLATCSKEKNGIPPAFTPNGTWEGKLGDSYFGIKVNDNGTLDRLRSDGSIAASGNWELNGNTFAGDYIFPDGNVVNFTATVNKDQRTLVGTWTNSGNNSGSLNAVQK